MPMNQVGFRTSTQVVTRVVSSGQIVPATSATPWAWQFHNPIPQFLLSFTSLRTTSRMSSACTFSWYLIDKIHSCRSIFLWKVKITMPWVVFLCIYMWTHWTPLTPFFASRSYVCACFKNIPSPFAIEHVMFISIEGVVLSVGVHTLDEGLSA